jgi:hypothetical protein
MEKLLPLRLAKKIEHRSMTFIFDLSLKRKIALSAELNHLIPRFY